MSEDEDGGDEVHKVDNGVDKIVKMKCTKCGRVVKTKGTFAHYNEVHGDLGNWNDVKDTLYERVEVPPPPPPKKKTPNGREEEQLGSKKYSIEPPEVTPNDLLGKIFNKYRGSKTFTEDITEYVMDIANDAGFLSPGELRSELLDMNVDPRVASKIYRLYDLKYRRWKESQKNYSKYETEIEGKYAHPEVLYKLPISYKDNSRVTGYGREEFEDEGLPVHRIRQRKQRIYKHVIDGQMLETDDPDEYFAWKRYDEERHEREEQLRRENERHELEKKKLEEEIKRIAKETTGKVEESENLVPVRVAEGVEINVSERDALLWHIVKGTKSTDEDKVAVTIEGQSVMVPSMAAAMIEMKKLERESKKEDLDKEVSFLRERNTAFAKQFEDIVSGKTSIHSTGQTLTDVLDKRMKEGHEIMKTVVNRLPLPGEGGELKYEAERSIDERRKLAKKIEKNLERSEKEIEAENVLLKALSEK